MFEASSDSFFLNPRKAYAEKPEKSINRAEEKEEGF
jgi:hypothetical protein